MRSDNFGWFNQTLHERPPTNTRDTRSKGIRCLPVAFFFCAIDEPSAVLARAFGDRATAGEAKLHSYLSTGSGTNPEHTKQHIESLTCIKGRGYIYCSFSEFQKKQYRYPFFSAPIIRGRVRNVLWAIVSFALPQQAERKTVWNLT